MATVPENLNKILQARYGEEVRGAIYDSIAQCYKDSTGESLDNLERRALANPPVNGGYIESGAELEAPYDDLNTFEANTIIFNDNRNLKNLPKNETCYILTYGNIYSNNVMKLQIVIYYDDTIYTRHIHGGSSPQWTEWKNITSPSMKAVVSPNSYVNFGIFNSMACMGDSFTQGGMASSDRQWISDKESMNSWPSIIAKRDFITVNNFAKGGHMVKDSYESVLPTVLSDKAYDAYTYCWGINDSGDTPALNGRWDGLNPEQRLGSSEDIVSGLEEPNHTFYGYYSSIIRKIQNHAPDALHLIIVSPPESEQPYRQMYKDATIDIAKKMGIPYINPIDDPFFVSNTYKAMNLGHPTRQGYLGMAIAYERLFSICVENNSQYFKKAVIG